jgi:hypothetical protein
MFRFCKREKPSTKTRITLIDTIILINKELSTFTLTETRCIGQFPEHLERTSPVRCISVVIKEGEEHMEQAVVEVEGAASGLNSFLQKPK